MKGKFLKIIPLVNRNQEISQFKLNDIRHTRKQ